MRASLGKEWERVPDCSLPNTNLKKKHADFVDTKKSKVLHDLPFSLSQPLKSADEWYIKFVTNTGKELINTEMLFG